MDNRPIGLAGVARLPFHKPNESVSIMNMAQLSVRQAAERLGVSQGRVRQRIDAGQIRAEKIGGRWLVDLPAGPAPRAQRGRPVDPRSVWASLLNLNDIDPVMDDPDSREAEPLIEHVARVSTATRWRASHRVRAALANDDPTDLFDWLSWRGKRIELRAAPADLGMLHADPLILLSGLSAEQSSMQDASLVEGYVANHDVEPLRARYWLEEPHPAQTGNVIIHAVPERPLQLSRLLLAADLAEHGNPRELARAIELVSKVAAQMTPAIRPTRASSRRTG